MLLAQLLVPHKNDDEEKIFCRLSQNYVVIIGREVYLLILCWNDSRNRTHFRPLCGRFP